MSISRIRYGIANIFAGDTDSAKISGVSSAAGAQAPSSNTESAMPKFYFIKSLSGRTTMLATKTDVKHKWFNGSATAGKTKNSTQQMTPNTPEVQRKAR